MNGYNLSLSGATLTALPSGALYWPSERCLIVSDLHLGKSERMARRGGALLPPYEVNDTLTRLDADISATGSATIICLGDTFDDLDAATLHEPHELWLRRLMSGRRWIWIEGNHDPGPIHLPGEHRREVGLGPLVFRHIAETGGKGEISGHYHPKARIAGQARPCFLADGARIILPAYGTYTGGLRCDAPVLSAMMRPEALIVLTGSVARAIPYRQTTANGSRMR